MWKRTASAAVGVAIMSLAASPRRRAELAARAVHDSIAIDQALDGVKQRFITCRTRLVLGLLSDDSLNILGELNYSRIDWYRPNEHGEWPALFAWEQAFVERYLPKSPATVLVAGAGAGREAYHLASMGHRVVACDPIPDFIAVMVQEMPPALDVRVFRARHEDLPQLGPAITGGSGLDLTSEPDFHAAIVGWCSFSHVLHRADQVRVLRTLASIVDGPILVSFFSRDPGESPPVTYPPSRFPSRHRDPSFGYQAVTGVYRQYTASEIFDLCAEAGVSVIEAVVHKRHSHSSYVIIQRDHPTPAEARSDAAGPAPVDAPDHNTSPDDRFALPVS